MAGRVGKACSFEARRDDERRVRLRPGSFTTDRATMWDEMWVQTEKTLSFSRISAKIWKGNGGEGGIRTHGTVARTTVFETAPIDHSGTSPQRWNEWPWSHPSVDRGGALADGFAFAKRWLASNGDFPTLVP